MVHLVLEVRLLGSGILGLELVAQLVVVVVVDLGDRVVEREMQGGMLLLRLFRREDWEGEVDIGDLDLVLLLLEVAVLEKKIGKEKEI